MAERSGTAKIAAGCDSGLDFFLMGGQACSVPYFWPYPTPEILMHLILSRILRQAREKRKRTTNNNVVITLLLAFCKRLYILK
jgi:hypothetical protein